MSAAIVFLEANATGTAYEAMQLARSWGCRIVFLAIDRPFYEGLADNPLDLADTVIDCDTYDPVQILRALRGMEVNAIVAFDDYHLPIAAFCAMALGLPHADVSSLISARYKDLTRQGVAGLPGSVGSEVMSERALSQACHGAFHYPVIVKPIDESGSVGVRLCRTKEDMLAALTLFRDHQVNLRLYKPTRQLLIEEYVEGEEFSCELLWSSDNARWTVVGITKKILAPPPYFVEAGHVFPAAISEGLAAKIRQRVLAWLSALHLQCAAAHVELRVREGEPHLIEINPRLAGGFITKLVLWHTGVDMVEHYLAFHMKTRVASRPQPRRYAASAIRFFLTPEVRSAEDVHRIQGELARMPAVVQHKLQAPAASSPRSPQSNYDRLGYVLLGAQSHTEISDALATIDSIIDTCLFAEEM